VPGNHAATCINDAPRRNSVTQLGAHDGAIKPPAADFVEIRLPADGAFLSVLRTATAALAARLNFTIDEIEDLRIAVDEACALVLAKAVPDGQLLCRFVIDPAAMTVSVTAPHPGRHCRPPGQLCLDGAQRPGRGRGRVDRRRPAPDHPDAQGTHRRRWGYRVSSADGASPESVDRSSELAIAREEARAMLAALGTLAEDDPERAKLRDQLVEMHLPLVEHLARRFRNPRRAVRRPGAGGHLGLIKSVDRFDTERGVEFSTYATPTIVGEIKRHFRDRGWAVRVPRRLQELRLALTTATAELSQRHGRAPTVAELGAHLGLSEEEILEGLESANAYSTLSLDAGDAGDDEGPTVVEQLGVEDEALESVEYRESLKPLLEQLSPREKKILLLRFFGNMTQSQIAEEIGISQMHVSRLLARTLAQLRQNLLVGD